MKALSLYLFVQLLSTGFTIIAAFAYRPTVSAVSPSVRTASPGPPGRDGWRAAGVRGTPVPAPQVQAHGAARCRQDRQVQVQSSIYACDLVCIAHLCLSQGGLGIGEEKGDKLVIMIHDLEQTDIIALVDAGYNDAVKAAARTGGRAETLEISKQLQPDFQL